MWIKCHGLAHHETQGVGTLVGQPQGLYAGLRSATLVYEENVGC
jgi:hypothetical protein